MESLPVVLDRVKFPSKSVFTPIEVPLKITFANITGSKVPASVILPFTFVCPETKAGKIWIIRQTSAIFFHLVIPDCKINCFFLINKNSINTKLVAEDLIANKYFDLWTAFITFGNHLN